MITLTREQRLIEMHDRLNEMDPAKRERLVKLTEALMAYRQLTVEQARLNLVATTSGSKDDISRYLSYNEEVVAPAKHKLGEQVYTMYKANAGDNFDAFREEIGDQFGEFREEIGAMLDEVSDRVKTGLGKVRGVVQARLGKAAVLRDA